VRIGFVQFAPKLGDQAANIERIGELIESAPQSDLLVLPELANSGYNFVSNEQAWQTSETIDDGEFVSFLCESAKKRPMHLVCGVNERDGDTLYNTAVVIGPDGLVGKYRKLHLFVNERDFFAPGDLGLPVFDIGSCRVGVLICFDWIFPEVWRVLALKGADVICHPSNLVIPDKCQRAVPVHCMMSGIFAVTANRFGTEGDLTFTGRSLIADPRGEILAKAQPEGDQVEIVEIDIAQARDKMITQRNDRITDRRPECYRELVD
jgi:predicted amidohydrolase